MKLNKLEKLKLPKNETRVTKNVQNNVKRSIKFY